MAGGIGSTVRLTTASISTGPLWASAAATPLSTSAGSSSLIPRTPQASAMAAKLGFLNSVPKSRKPVDFCSISMKPRALLLNTTTFTGRPSCARLRKSPISMVKPPSPDSEITCRPGNAVCAPMACGIALAIEPCQKDPISRRAAADLFGPHIHLCDANPGAAGIELAIRKIGSEHQQNVAIEHGVIAGGEADQSGHADVKRVVPLDMLLAPERMHDRSLEAVRQREDFIMRALASR